MKTDDLISKLSASHKEVKPLASFWNRYLKLVFVSILCIFTGVSLVGLREDWRTLFQDPMLFAQSFLILFGAMLSAAVALMLSVPSTKKIKSIKYLAATPFVFWILILLFELRKAPDFYPSLGLLCLADVVFMGVVPGIFMLVLVRQGAALDRLGTSFFAFVAAATFGALGTQLTCHNNDPLHLILWHLLPVTLLGLVGIFLAKKILKKI